MLLAVAESEGIQSDLIPKIATGFCGGVARTCGMCGALSGGIMVISMSTGRTSSNESVTETYDIVRKLLDQFQVQFGSTNCKELTGCDLGTEDGQHFFKTNNLRQQCRVYTEGATRIALSVIKDKGKIE